MQNLFVALSARHYRLPICPHWTRKLGNSPTSRRRRRRLTDEEFSAWQASLVDVRMLAFVGGALYQSKIPASPELAAASANHPADQNDDGPLPRDVRSAFAGILEACDGDPFMAVGSLIEGGHAMPAETRGALASALTFAGSSEARGAAVMFLLDPDSAARRAVARALAQVAASLTPTEVRRLVAMRNWRPENERPEVDAVIRKARGAGIDCAQWVAPRKFSQPPSTVLQRKAFCWYRRSGEKYGFLRSSPNAG
jgi:hypothetical protein